MKICFCGLGSIGTRHIKNLSKILKGKNIQYTIDALRSTSVLLDDEIVEIVNQTYTNWRDLECDYDIVFVTNPTASHYEIMQKLIIKTKHMFIEKPIFNKTDVCIDDLEFKPNGIYYVACPLRYSPVIRYIKDYVKGHHVFSVRAICSSYLPDWRKDTDYRKIYSALKELGGGVTLDLIHEWDYITYLFGDPSCVKTIKGTYSNLEISSDDLAIYIAEYTDKLVELHLDYFGRVSQREMHLYTADELIKADVLNNRITFCSSGDMVNFDKEDIYINEMKGFLNMVLCGAENTNTPHNAFSTLKIALGEV
ncbi:Gfo/Idh/MocA family protein [Desulfosporosinus nitroreducens]|uniref:Gfo/Idh/MocA family protein n=1 Tax=Desulfosporosinus nitroreducens TaxID=2018668 RepID=UPI00207C2071|nr:Gfo/Idh/MocA family oxidoreductase [Desulfosporosinus nitroreducens]MCO1601324.1 Gfo/Idh/MocA family oxidoreductase [Desulfosporosinus nitroreducens]